LQRSLGDGKALRPQEAAAEAGGAIVDARVTQMLHAHAAADGTVSIMFTDLEGSTEVVERLGDWRSSQELSRHEELVGELVAKHGGVVVKSIGDGLMLAFPSARRALCCAIEVQERVARGEQAGEGMRVRIGLHTGEAIERGGDLFGKHVVLAARISALAQGGEILVSGLVRELTGSLGEFSFDPGREVQLKGLSGSYHVHRVNWRHEPEEAGLARLGRSESRVFEMPKTRYARGEVNLAYQVIGDGPFDVALVPGFVTHLEINWEMSPTVAFLRRLASFSRLITYDRRGMGLSDRPDSVSTLEDGMDDLRAVLDAAGSKRTVVFGASEGGPLSCLFASTYPDRVAALILFGAFPRVLRGPDYPAGVEREVHDGWARLIEERWGDPLLLHQFAPSLADDEGFARLWGKLLRYGTSPHGAGQLLRLYQQIDIRSVLPTIRVPTLVLHRTGDRLADVRGGRYMADHIPGAEYVELPGSDHLVVAGGGQVLDEVERFLADLDLAGSENISPAPEQALGTVLVIEHASAAANGDRVAWAALVESSVRRLGADEVKLEGDRCLAVFDGPIRAVRCAGFIAESARRRGLAVKAGLHTGECDPGRRKLGGATAKLAASLAAQAQDTEVLLSHAVSDLVAGAGFEITPRAVHDAAPRAWRAFALQTRPD
jgi:class 3 adenylate cyclase/pimeloyl-ACP methyl ester carboxylesterase